MVLAVKDFNGTQQNLATEVASSGVLTPHYVVEVNGLPAAIANPLPVIVQQYSTLNVVASLSFDGNTAGAAHPLPVTFVSSVPTFTATSSFVSNLTLKGSPGNLYSCYATTGPASGYLMIFDATNVPADGNVTPKDVVFCPANSTTSIDYGSTPEPFTNAILAVFSSTGPFVKTASATAFLKGAAL